MPSRPRRLAHFSKSGQSHPPRSSCKAAGIRLNWPVHRGPTLSLCYTNPDGTRMELIFRGDHPKGGGGAFRETLGFRSSRAHFPGMTDAERRLLVALAWMCEQYLGDGKGEWLDHQAMSAGEDAIALLAQYGMVEPSGRGGRWTDAGRALLAP